MADGFSDGIVGGDAVIGVHPVGHRQTVRRKMPEGEGGVVQQRSVGGRLCHRHRVVRTEEQQHFVQLAGQIVPSGGQDLFVVVTAAAQAQQLHRLGQIDRPAVGVLGVDGGNHQALAQKQLVLHLPGAGVGRIVKGQRPEVGRILQHGLHEFTVEVGQKGITQAQHIPDGRQKVGEAVELLLPARSVGVIAHEGRKEAEFQPAEGEVGGGVLAEAAEVGTAVEEAAHLDGGHHLDVGQQLAPRGVVVAQPDAAPPVRPDDAAAAVEQGALAGAERLERLTGGTGHGAAVEVVDAVVAHPPGGGSEDRPDGAQC